MSVQSRFYRLVLLTFASVFAIPLTVQASKGELTSFMPDKTLLYIGLTGPEATKKARSETALGKMLADPEIETFTRTLFRVVDDLLSRVAKENGEPAVYESAKRIAVALTTHPVAFGLHDAGMNPQSGPFLEAALIVELGDAAASMVTDLETLLTATGLPASATTPIDGGDVKALPLPIPGGVYYGAEGGYFFVAVSQEAVRCIRAGIKGDANGTLKTNQALQRAQARIGGDATSRAMLVHLSVNRMHSILTPFIPMFTAGDMALAGQIQQSLESFGVLRVVSLTVEFHHRAGGSISSAYLQTNGPTRSLLFAEKAGNVTDAELALIPAEARFAAVAHVDIARTWKDFRKVVGMLDSAAITKLDSGLAKLEENCGVNARTELIDKLGHSLVVYIHPSHNVNIFIPQGIVASIDTVDPARITKALKKLIASLDREIDGAKVTLEHMAYRGHELHYVGVNAPIPLAPAFTTHKGRLYFALYPQVLKSVVDYVEDGDGAKDSLLANAEFVKGRKIVGESIAIAWSDRGSGLDGIYSLFLPLATAGVGAAQMKGAKVDLSCIPSARAFSQQLFGQVAATSWDEHGLLSQWYGPLPPSLSWLAGNMETVGTSALLVSILLPSLSRARELSKRLVCASNIKGIGTSMMIAMNDDPMSDPPTFESLVQAGFLLPEQLACPSSGKTGNYIQVPLTRKEIEERRQNQVWLYEPISNHGAEGGNILFSDGHVGFFKSEEFNRIIATIPLQRRSKGSDR